MEMVDDKTCDTCKSFERDNPLYAVGLCNKTNETKFYSNSCKGWKRRKE